MAKKKKVPYIVNYIFIFCVFVCETYWKHILRVGHRLTLNALCQQNETASGCCNCVFQSVGVALSPGNMLSPKAPVLLKADKALFKPAETKGTIL